jgi:hypothetical protein
VWCSFGSSQDAESAIYLIETAGQCDLALEPEPPAFRHVAWKWTSWAGGGTVFVPELMMKD